jgi:xanthine dehydrogenase accessory factor
LSKEIQKIIEKLDSLGTGEKAILATVVDVVGSGYRRPGARMLIDRNGYGIGTVSGGCLEADVLERAKKVLQTDEPTVITYDTTKDENSIFGLGMGCRGIVRILLEPIKPDVFLLKYFVKAIHDRERQVIATLISQTDEAPIGARIVYNRKLGYQNDGLPVSFKDLPLDEDCQNVFNGKENSTVKSYQLENSTAEFFIEKIEAPLNLLLFGAGYDALPLIKFAKELGWRIVVIDHRPAYSKAERLPEADEIITSNIQDLDEHFFEDENSVAVIMTHNYDRDREILPRLLKSNCLYVGALGPKKRTEKILAEAGTGWSENLHAPIGLDIGADTPEAIALAIVAEIQAVLKNREGGFLRQRQGSIYGRS